MSALAAVTGVDPTAARRSLVVPAIVAGAWAVILAADATGLASGLHHHALIEDGPPLPIATAAFLGGWVVMVAAMMLPASLQTIAVVEAAAGRSIAPACTVGRWAFLALFGVVWATFGLAAFIGDVVLHQVVDATPWLADRPWLISAAVLAVAGVVQFAPLTQRSLAACRHAVWRAPGGSSSLAAFARHGFRHGWDCLGASWALMLLMFAEGFASPLWMVALTSLMAYEVSGRHAVRAVQVAGGVLLMAALATLNAG